MDTQGPGPGRSAGMRPGIQSRTQQLADCVDEHLAVLIRKAGDVVVRGAHRPQCGGQHRGPALPIGACL